MKTPPDAVKWLEAETLKVLGTAGMKEKMYKAGFQVRAKGAAAAWDRVSKEVALFKGIIEQVLSLLLPAGVGEAKDMGKS
jgi:hypothetical protein